jgi:hypothetical protein
VLPRLDRKHDLVVCEHSRHGQHAATEGLSQDDQVRADAVVLRREQAARASQARLHLISDEQHAVLLAERRSGSQVPCCWDDDACFALDRLNHEGCDAVPRVDEDALEGSEVVVGDRDEAWDERPVVRE